FLQMDLLLRSWHFDSVGHFLSILFHGHKSNPLGSDPRSLFHAKSVGFFLSGRNEFTTFNLLKNIYEHPRSHPATTSKRKTERDMYFDAALDPAKINYARPCISVWATQLVRNRLYKDFGKLGHKNKD
ncbi:hypothetical protein C8J56DRAFT_753972, partial [Mycena floridula]